MNKRFIWILLVLAALVGLFFFFNSKNNSAGTAVNFYCEEGNLKAEFGKDYVVLTFPDGKNMLLPQTVSGSGIRYELGTTTFVSKGDSAFLMEKDQKIYTNCVAGYQTTKDDTNTFTSISRVFSFSYPKQFKLSGGDIGYSQDWAANTTDLGLLLSVVKIPRTFFDDKTNFGDAKFTVGMSADMKAINNCLIYKSGLPVTTSEETINGTKFAKYIFTDVGAGNYYETTSYRAIHDDFCYKVEYTIHSSNILNYSPDQGVKEFDKAKIISVLEGMVKSFKFVDQK